MKLVKRLMLFLGLLYVYFCLIPNINLAKITLNVVDENGKPVDGAQGDMNFTSEHLLKDALKGFTNRNGKWSIMSRAPNGSLLGGVSKDGYYYTGLIHRFYRKNFGVWLPWNEQINIVLRPIMNPVPMYARNLDWYEVPVIGKEIGYDLMKSDWVKPYGEGKSADFMVKVDKRFNNMNDYETKLTIRFSNPHDGIQVIKENNRDHSRPFSSYRLPRMAPEEGYQAKLVKQLSRGITGYCDDGSDDNNYIFRVRSVTDKDGKLVRAMYGKILGDIGFAPRDPKTAKIRMYYYLNPDYTRNLEFEPKRNLLTNLPINEQARIP